MIEALMYGITPKANRENRCRAPPVNMFKKSNIPPAWLAKKFFSASGSTPGTGICVPSRKMMIAPRVNRIRLRSSGTRNR